jgi:hypothetical protein
MPFNSKRRSEYVADIMAVIAPVHAELKLHHNAGSDAHNEVDTKQRTPEFCHLPPDEPSGHDINGFHDGKQHGQTQCQR